MLLNLSGTVPSCVNGDKSNKRPLSKAEVSAWHFGAQEMGPVVDSDFVGRTRELLGGDEVSKAPWPGDGEEPPLPWGRGRPTAFPGSHSTSQAT